MAIESQPPPDPIDIDKDQSDEWDPSRLEQALIHLAQAHTQLRSLRTVIPTMLRPLFKPSGNPEDIFHEFTEGVKYAANQIDVFSKLMKSDSTTEVLDKAEASRLRRENVRPWLVTEDEDWLGETIQKDKSEDDKKEGEEQDGENGVSMQDEEEILARFRETHPSCRAGWDEGKSSITVTLSPLTDLAFRIERLADLADKIQWVAHCEGTRKLHMGIQRCIDKRSKLNDLGYLLDLLASYDDIYSRKCTACGSLLDSKPQLPVIRKRVKKPNIEGNPNIIWEAYHEGCI